MRLVLACPECGCINWKDELTEECAFVCSECAAEVYPEEMEAVEALE